jgi:hypothetical protein
LLLFKLRQLVIELVLVHRFANRRRCDRIRNLLAQRVLLPEFLPA